MNESIKTVHFTHDKNEKLKFPAFTLKKAEKARKYHKSFPEYKETPLKELKALAEYLGIGKLYVKDESYRFGLNAFKVLGGSYCIGNYIKERLGLDDSEMTYEKMTSPKARDKLGNVLFVTATDGNHGRGIAWTANKLGQKSLVLMPKGSAVERLENIRLLGSEAYITELNYDDTVRLAEKKAAEAGGVFVQDTAWEGYEKIPTWIMQGYMTMALEIAEQLKDTIPTHIFLQAGVGAMSGAVTGFFADYYKENKPVITIVEPNAADCIFRTAQSNDGKIHAVTGDMNTIMAGLACGEPCTIGWKILKDAADNFVSMPDYVAAKGMRILGNPMGGDDRIISGESGASTLGFVAEVMQNRSLDYLREKLGIDERSRVLCISTEGDTDRENYRRIVWDGAYSGMDALTSS